MEKRITTLEIRMDQTTASIDRLDRSITELRRDMDKKFIHLEEKIDKKFVLLDASITSQRKDCDKKFLWLTGLQITSLLAAMSFMGKIAQLY